MFEKTPWPRGSYVGRDLTWPQYVGSSKVESPNKIAPWQLRGTSCRKARNRSRRSKLLSRKVMQVQPLTLTEHQFWKGSPFLFGNCHENDSQLVECLAGLLEPLPVEIGLEKMQMVIRQGAAKVGLLAHWKHKTPSWEWDISFQFVGILQNLPGIWLIWIAD